LKNRYSPHWWGGSADVIWVKKYARGRGKRKKRKCDEKRRKGKRQNGKI
jgi:hypothetical protein